MFSDPFGPMLSSLQYFVILLTELIRHSLGVVVVFFFYVLRNTKKVYD